MTRSFRQVVRAIGVAAASGLLGLAASASLVGCASGRAAVEIEPGAIPATYREDPTNMDQPSPPTPSDRDWQGTPGTERSIH